MTLNRRSFLQGAAALLPTPALAQGAGPRVVVIGGGFAGATCARMLKRLEPRLAVTLVEANASFIASIWICMDCSSAVSMAWPVTLKSMLTLDCPEHGPTVPSPLKFATASPL